MDIHRKLKINWWLWMSLSIPPIVYSWLRVRDVKGWMVSDWGYLVFYLKQTHFVLTRDIWNYMTHTFFENALLPLLLGWIAQYFIVLGWDAFRSRGGAKDFADRRIQDNKT